MIFSKKIGGEPPILYSYNSYNFFNKKNWEDILYFSSGRNAIIEILNFEKISEIYIPEYYCYPVYELFSNIKNINIVKYHSFDQLQNQIEGSNKKERKLVILLLFNGMHESLPKSDIEFDESLKIIKFVDAAMTPALNRIDFNYDYLLTNPRKFYRLPIGSFVFSKKKTNFKNKLILNPLENARYLTVKILARFFLNLRIDILEKLGLLLNNYSEKIVPINLDIFTYQIIRNISIRNLSYKRIEQFNIYYKLLDPIKKKYFFLSPASSQDCPFGFILRIKNRDKLIKYLSSQRIFVSTLWEIPEHIKSELDIETIKKSLEVVVLPIGLQYSIGDIEKVCQAILNYFIYENNL